MENKNYTFISTLLELFGVRNFEIYNENRFCPKSISETHRTTHIVVQMDNPEEHEILLKNNFFKEKVIQNHTDMKCFEKTFETEKMLIWIYPQNKHPDLCNDFVQHYIYKKYSQTII